MRIKFLMSLLIITLFICPGASRRERELPQMLHNSFPIVFVTSQVRRSSLRISGSRVLKMGHRQRLHYWKVIRACHIKTEPVPVILSTRLHETLASSNIQFKCLQVARQMGAHFLSLICCPQRPLFSLPEHVLREGVILRVWFSNLSLS